MSEASLIPPGYYSEYPFHGPLKLRWFVTDPDRLDPEGRNYLFSKSREEAVSSAMTIWMINTAIELYEENSKGRVKRIKVM